MVLLQLLLVCILSPTLDTGRADLRLLRVLVSKVPWENAFKSAGIHQYWSPPPKGHRSRQIQTRQKANLNDQGSSGTNKKKGVCPM